MLERAKSLRLAGWAYWIFPWVLMVLRLTGFREGMTWTREGLFNLVRDTLIFSVMEPFFFVFGAITQRERLGELGYAIAVPFVVWAALGWWTLGSAMARWSRRLVAG
jgi:hypothetical protein